MEYPGKTRVLRDISTAAIMPVYLCRKPRPRAEICREFGPATATEEERRRLLHYTIEGNRDEGRR